MPPLLRPLDFDAEELRLIDAELGRIGLRRGDVRRLGEQADGFAADQRSIAWIWPQPRRRRAPRLDAAPPCRQVGVLGAATVLGDRQSGQALRHRSGALALLFSAPPAVHRTPGW
ncbi:MAG TPA: hypothetical protein VN213_08550 [Solirubrobacteraceae bacterium]|nr:hypothetical protein [Solirubrobacteraceae bacterium]